MAPSLTGVPPPGGAKPAWWSETISKAKEIATNLGRPNSPPQGPPPGTGSQNASGWSQLENQAAEGGAGRWQENANDARRNSREEPNRGADSRRHEDAREARSKERRFSDDREDRYSPRSGRDRDDRYRRQSGEDQHGFRSKESGGRRFRDTDLRRSKDDDEERSSGSRRDSRDNLGYKRSEQKRFSDDCSKGSKPKNYDDGNQRQDKDLREMLDSRTGDEPDRVGASSKGSCLDIDLRKSSRETEVYSPTRPTYTPTKKSEVCPSGESLPSVVEELASMVAISGEELEEVARGRNQTTPELKFLFEKNSSLYSKYRARVSELKKTLEETDNKKRTSGGQSTSEPPKKRRSRWGSKETTASIPPSGVGPPGMVVPMSLGAPGVAIPTQLGAPGVVIPMQLGAPGVAMPTQLGAPGLAIPMQLGAPVGVIPPSALMPRFQQNIKLSEIQRSNPGLVSYAIKVFGTTELSDAQWKQCEDQLKMSVVYGQLAAKQAVANVAGGKGRNKYEYDSDEDTTEGTWEHRQRKQEMQKTQPEPEADLHQSHHIGDYLPPEELTKFMDKYKALRNGDKWDSSEYQENKLQSDNKGFKMLQKMGWSEGAGLGSGGMGITAPIGKSGMAGERMGLGTEKPGEISANDDEFDSYRKRMMMAYRFRPNPLNNPRRAYY